MLYPYSHLSLSPFLPCLLANRRSHALLHAQSVLFTLALHPARTLANAVWHHAEPVEWEDDRDYASVQEA